jgi:addiction module RelE/StbE family toxin
MENEPRIDYLSIFDKQFDATPLDIKQAFLDTITLFLIDQMHPALRNHPLQGKYAGYRSIDVTGDYRAIFRETYSGETQIITFYKIGTHKELYEQQG